MAHPRPTLETYKYQMPGEKEAPIEHLYLFDLVDNKRKEIKVAAYKDQSIGLEYKPMMQKQRDMEDQAVVWQGDNNRFFLTRSSRDLHRIDVLFLYDRTGFRCTCYKRTDEYLSGNSSFKSLEWWKRNYSME